MDQELFHAAQTKFLDPMEEELFKAALSGDVKFLDRIQDRKVLARRNLRGDTACHVALQQGHLRFASAIASLHPPILFQPDSAGDTVLHFALKIGQPGFFVECISFLRNRLPEICVTPHPGYKVSPEARDCRNSVWNKEGKSLAYVAAEHGRVEALRILLETPAIADTGGPNESTALHAAVLERKYDIIPVLIEHDGELSGHLDGNGHIPLHLAVILNDRRMISLLLERSPLRLANVLSKDGISPFHLAATLNYLEIFELLLQLCPNCCHVNTSRGQNALHLAVQEKATAIVEFILKDKKLSEMMINQQDTDGNTPVHIAAYRDDKKMMNTLLASQVRVLPIKNKENLTADDISKAHKERKLKEKTERMQSRLQKAMEDFHSSLLVMATLITTVTFTAAFTMPGGYKSDGPDKGMATLVGRATFRIFVVSDTLSMCSSIIATASLILFSVIFSTQKKFSILKVAIGSIATSIVFMLVAFAAAVWVVIGSECKWLAILTVAATSCTPLIIILVLGGIMVPSGNEDAD